MRVYALIEALGEGEPDGWVEALAALIGRTRGGRCATPSSARSC